MCFNIKIHKQMLIYPTFYLILYTSTYTSTYKGLYVINQLVQNGNKSMHMDSELKKIEQVFSGHIISLAFLFVQQIIGTPC